ncbi:MAG: hypothetical protein ACE5H0_00355 [Bacteroidota bacterium]
MNEQPPVRLKLPPFLVVAALSASAFAVAEQEPSVVFYGDFSTYQEGSDGSPEWQVTKGDWQVIEDHYCQRNKEGYDCGSLLNIYVNESFLIEIMF